MNNEQQEIGALAGPLIFTLPASSFVVILSLDWLEWGRPGSRAVEHIPTANRSVLRRLCLLFLIPIVALALSV